MKTSTAETIIQMLHLQPHPEGGFYHEVYRSNIEVDEQNLPVGYKGIRRMATSIYFLLRSGDISRLHRIRSDEIWYHHSGSSLKIVMLDKEGKKQTRMLGSRIEKAEHPQLVIPAGTIFGAEVHDSESYALMSCVVSPGFEFSDFEMFDKEDLLQAYPKHADIIEKFSSPV